MSSSILLTEHRNHAIVTLNRPSKFNCLPGALMDELAGIISNLSKNDGLLALIITGAGGVFSTGADLSEIAALDPATAFEFSRKGQTILASFNEAAPVTIAAIDGHCLGGGLDMATSCDLRFATPRATFQHPGAKRGIITGWGGTQRLPRLIGIDAARGMLVAGDRIDAEEALRIGLVNKISEDALDYALQFVQRVTAKFTREQLIAIKEEVQCYAN